MATYRIFVSFQAEDMKHANLIDAWGANENHDFNVYNERLRMPINSTQAEYVKRLLRERIERASVVVCLIGATTSLSSWVNWELAHGKNKSKGLVGVLLAPHNRKPLEINDAGAMFVPFKQDEITKAIAWAAVSGKSSGDFVLKRD